VQRGAGGGLPAAAAAARSVVVGQCGARRAEKRSPKHESREALMRDASVPCGGGGGGGVGGCIGVALGWGEVVALGSHVGGVHGGFAWWSAQGWRV